MSARLEKIFSDCAEKNRAALITFVMGGDPDFATSEKILQALPTFGADIIEIGMPFSDPMADGPVIQAAGQRALKAGINLNHILELAKSLREKHPAVGIVLMGYYNPVYAYGEKKFLVEAKKSGVDGILLVDLPPEEDSEFANEATTHGISLIKLIAPTTPETRMKMIEKKASGFIYYVSIAGITGTHSAKITEVKKSLAKLKKITKLPIAVGFGISQPSIAGLFAKFSDGVVVGSALVEIAGHPTNSAKSIENFVRELAAAMQR